MGKRSNFERREADFYPTPQAAVVPLIPYLRGNRAFAEPCAGDGALVGHLEPFGLRCVYSGDIATGQDALERGEYDNADVIITSPPWSRDLMHRLIAHFQNIRPTWLLLDSDWAYTKQAVPFLSRCTDIVAVGRVKWIEGSKHAGKDNCAWYRFHIRHTAGPVFHGRDNVIRVQRIGICEQCRRAYEPQRSSSRFCSETCRRRAHRNTVDVTSSVTLAPSADATVSRSGLKETAPAGCWQNQGDLAMLAPFDPDPECPFCSGKGFKHLVLPEDGIDQVARCDCTNWSSYAELRRTKGLTMKQALETWKKE